MWKKLKAQFLSQFILTNVMGGAFQYFAYWSVTSLLPVACMDAWVKYKRRPRSSNKGGSAGNCLHKILLQAMQWVRVEDSYY